MVGAVTAGTGLESQVLVLNRMWMAVRVVDARRALCLLFKQAAEVIRVDDGSYTGHDFEAWAEGGGFNPGVDQFRVPPTARRIAMQQRRSANEALHQEAFGGIDVRL